MSPFPGACPPFPVSVPFPVCVPFPVSVPCRRRSSESPQRSRSPQSRHGPGPALSAAAEPSPPSRLPARSGPEPRRCPGPQCPCCPRCPSSRVRVQEEQPQPVPRYRPGAAPQQLPGAPLAHNGSLRERGGSGGRGKAQAGGGEGKDGTGDEQYNTGQIFLEAQAASAWPCCSFSAAVSPPVGSAVPAPSQTQGVSSSPRRALSSSPALQTKDLYSFNIIRFLQN